MIRLSKVSKRFSGKRSVSALKNIDLQIQPGEMVSIVGPSGSGKSTLLNLMGTLDRPTSGEIEVGGVRLTGISDKALTHLRRDKIGFIFQFFNLLPTLTCLENVSIPLHLRGWNASRIAHRAQELLERVGLAARLHHHPDELSGGEKQRVAIARALSIYPPILLADEPTGNLDSHTTGDILNLIHAIHDDLKTTVVLVTHDNGVAASCPRTIRIQDGLVAEDRRRQCC